MAKKVRRHVKQVTLDPETIEYLDWLDKEYKLGPASRLIEQAIRSHFQDYLKIFRTGDDDHGGQRT